MAIKTQYIIAPYQCDPDTWVMRVAWLHNRLVANMDDLPYIILSQHANILIGCYGDCNDEAQRKIGLRATLLHVGHTAMGYDNELLVIIPDDGNPTDGMASQLRVWMETRNDFDFDMNIYAGTWQHWLEEFATEHDPIPRPKTKRKTQPDIEADSEDYTEV